MSEVRISIVVEEPAWTTSRIRLSRIKAAMRLVLEERFAAPMSSESQHCELVLLLGDDERLRKLNVRFRNKDSATNVLAFPAADKSGRSLGDIAIAFGVASAEAARSGISLEAHTLHLAAHGVLHLLGYDHVRAREARIMENLEIAILRQLGVANPYANKVLAG